jgi:hypothetical protein
MSGSHRSGRCPARSYRFLPGISYDSRGSEPLRRRRSWQIVLGKGRNFSGRAGRDDDRRGWIFGFVFPPSKESTFPEEADHRESRRISPRPRLSSASAMRAAMSIPRTRRVARDPKTSGLLNELAASRLPRRRGDPAPASARKWLRVNRPDSADDRAVPCFHGITL